LVRDAPPELLRALELVPVTKGEVVHDNRLRNSHVWMPLTCVLSSRAALPDGASVEIALHGEEGFIGIWPTVGEPRFGKYHARSIALRDGLAWRMPVPAFREALARSDVVRAAFVVFQTTVGSEMLGRAICYRHHRIDRQLCRWLLLYRERASSDDISCTHQCLAEILGVRREGITEALGMLEASGAVDLRRGGVRIVDAGKLAANACGCYRPEDGRLSDTMMAPTMTKTADSAAAFVKAAP
jgi:CRP-like cAMP-binding protein